MIISFKHNFIYWRPLKVGGSSVLQALGEYCEDDDIVGNPVPIVDILRLGLKLYGKNFTKYKRHMFPDAIKEVANIDWDSFFKFTIVRNPWDMAVSMYHWENWMKPGSTFTEWLHRESLNPEPYFFTDDYYFKDGKRTANYYLRYENLESEYKRICEWIGIPYKKLPMIKNYSRVDKKHYSNYYTLEDIEIISRKFPQTIKEFGYEFENNMANRVAM